MSGRLTRPAAGGQSNRPLAVRGRPGRGRHFLAAIPGVYRADDEGRVLTAQAADAAGWRLLK